jgi:outer membrane receptor protein involved in Fe transport
MKRSTKLLFTIFLFCSHVSVAQTMQVSGTVYDSTGSTPLPHAIATAVRLKDSLLLGFSYADSEGHFSINPFPIDTFTLLITYPKREDKHYFIFGHDENYEIKIPVIKMIEESDLLQEVVIYATKDPIYYRGDTLVYVADSFKVSENAVIEDLLKKLPGIKVEKDGSLKSQGKAIGQVLVDGDEFFGGDATIATKNLAADGLKTVEIYEKTVENSTDGTEDKIQVMDLKLKEEAKKGYFGRTSLASDFTNFYEGELLVNKFNGTQKISIFALGSNTPRSSFGWSDRNRFGLDNENNYQMNDDGDYQWTGSNDGTGIPQTFKSGIYFSDKIGKEKQTKVNFNYSLNEVRLNSSSKSASQYFLEDTTYHTNDSTTNYQLNQAHAFNLSFSTQIDSLTSIEIIPKLTYSTGQSDNMDASTFLSEYNSIARLTNIQNSNNSEGYSINTQGSIFRKFKKPKRKVTLKYTYLLNVNETNGKLLSSNIYFDGSYVNDTIDQKKLSENRTQSHQTLITYVEPLSKKLNLELTYQYEQANTSQNKETRNKINGSYSDLDLNFSNQFENINIQNRLGALFVFSIKKFTVTGGSRLRNIVIENKNLMTSTLISQNFTNVLPRFSVHYRASQSKQVSIRYSTTANQPSINNLQPVPNNANPNRIQIGNPNLQPSYAHKIQMNFNNWQSLTGRYVYSRLDARLTQNDFVDSTTYNLIFVGQSSSQTINTDGNLSANFYGGAGIPLLKKKIEFSPNLNANYARSNNYINGQMNTSENRTMSGSTELSFNSDSIECSISSSISYTRPKNSITSFSSNPFTTQTYYAGISWKLPWHLKIATDITYTVNGGQRADGYKIDYFIWNAMISRSFLKTENLNLSLTGNDILNQNISAQRQSFGNVITDNKTKIISRYFLLKLTMKFNNNKTKEDEDHNEWD